ncbi:sensor histidine kinase [Seonamhaeicola marinus]|uniref:Signal transduction histidine kinase internal region domain-containing protein n=1 Tax=Seonamhaeicola marinus TaxID=1912246 RepID=A0A5D0HUR0_9FLAO|nr:histidine kinase [Seonamhaeicola marinus]TYA74209.1 hypothetical protein FUA24_12805 [Seonamhaeicola marinus]
MKKIALILILLLPLLPLIRVTSKNSLLVEIEENGYSKKEKDQRWEYIKDKLFEGKIDRNFTSPQKINGPILFALNNASRQDSLAVNEIIQGLKKIIPTKPIAFFSHFTCSKLSEFNEKSNHVIEWKGYSKQDIVSSTLKIYFEKEEYKNKRGANQNKKALYFSFKKETSLNERTKTIQFEVLKTICFLNKTNHENWFLDLSYPPEAIFNEPTYNILDKEFTEIDQFLVKKLYEDSFNKQFSNYMYDTYPWRYASLFLNKNKTILKVNSLIGFLALLIFVLSFSLFNNRKTSYLQYAFPMFITLFGLTNLHYLHSHLIEIGTPNISLKSAAYIFAYVVCSTVSISGILWLLEQKIVTHFNFTYKYIMKLVLTFSALSVSVLLAVFVSNDLEIYTKIYYQLFIVFAILTLGRGLLIYLNHFTDSEIKKKELELIKLREVNAKNELKSLHAHINPHFLYNALNSIVSLMHESTNKAEEMIISLSDLFRYSINRREKKMSTIEDEVEMVKNYLKIEKIRFGERLEFSIDVDKTTLSKEIPMYILQPLIENAVKHGVSKLESKGFISLRITEKESNLIINVSDNGPHFQKQVYSGYGLQSIYDLLRLCYGDKASLTWTNTPKKETTITIPS